jgi:hypothetical protein
MGTAMEVVRREHNLNMPRGWVPSMRRLRDPNRAGLPNYLLDSIREFPGEEAVSALMRRVIEEPRLQATMLTIITEDGLPRGWIGALPYMERVIEAWANAGGRTAELERVRDALRQRLSLK